MISSRYQYQASKNTLQDWLSTKHAPWVMYILVQYRISKSSWWQLCSNVLQSCSPISHSNISKSSFNTAQTRLRSVTIQCANSWIKIKPKIAKKEEKERSKWTKSPSFSLRTFLSVSSLLRTSGGISGGICTESGASELICNFILVKLNR